MRSGKLFGDTGAKLKDRDDEGRPYGASRRRQLVMDAKFQAPTTAPAGRGRGTASRSGLLEMTKSLIPGPWRQQRPELESDEEEEAGQRRSTRERRAPDRLEYEQKGKQKKGQSEKKTGSQDTEGAGRYPFLDILD